MGGGPPGGMGGAMGGRPPGGDPPEGAEAPSAAVLGAMLMSGERGIHVTPTVDGLAVAWGELPPITLVVGGPRVKVAMPGGVVKVRAWESPFGLALERRANGVVFLETLFREGEALIVVIETTGSAHRETFFVVRVYHPAPQPVGPGP
jgi:hypothetical protein